MAESREQLQEWADDGGEELVTRAFEHVAVALHPDTSAPRPRRLPRVLALSYRVEIIELEILNGGFSQYFFNGRGDLAPDTADDFDLLGAAELASIVRSAYARYEAAALTIDGAREQGVAGFEQAREAVDFEDLDDGFMEITINGTAGTDLAAAWLIGRLDELEAALNAPEGE